MDPKNPLFQGRPGDGMSIQMVNFDNIMKLATGLTPKLLEASVYAVENETKHNFDISQDLVPIGPTGNLRASGRIEPVDTFTAGEVAAGIAYGGPAGSGRKQTINVGNRQMEISPQVGDVDYAIYVHEDLSKHHQYGQAKFVEGPVRGALTSGKAAERMGRDVRRFMKW